MSRVQRSLPNAAFVWFAIFACGLAGAQSADTHVIDGKTYEELEFLGTNGEMATFYSKQGPFAAKWTALPLAVRQQFAKAYEEAFNREIAETAAILGEPFTITGPVIRKLDQGVLVMWNEVRVILRGYPDAKTLTEGVRISVMAKRAGQMEYQDLNGQSKVVRVFTVERLVRSQHESGVSKRGVQ